jgi:hypothetical protein
MTIFKVPESRTAAPAFPSGESAEQSLLAWLIALPESVDPASAAKALLAATSPSSAATPLWPRSLELLAEVAQWSAQKRAALLPRRRGERSRAGA